MLARRKLDAVLLLDKPKGPSSNAALQRVKRLYRAARAGHGGTLDPLASGLLPILFGEATKFAGRVLESDKSYTAWTMLGETTATGDAEGPVLERRAVDVSDAQVESVLGRFRGRILQVPPMYSALKRGGRPLYELARAGSTVERPARPVNIRKLELLSRSGDCLELGVECSKGTYLRSLAVDIGDALNTGAHLAALRRTGAGGFSLQEAVGLESLESLDVETLDSRLIPLERLFRGLPRVELDAMESARFRNGQILKKQCNSDGLCGVFSDRGELMGLGSAARDGSLRALRLRAAAPDASG